MKEKIERAFDYRGDVTIDMDDGTSVEGFLFNRTFQAQPDCPEGFVLIYRAGDGERVQIGTHEITDIRLTGVDTAKQG